ncbi:unnamed protein product, partial [Mesorhabditis spiculigera]
MLLAMVDFLIVPTTIASGKSWLLLAQRNVFESRTLTYGLLMLYCGLFAQILVFLMFLFLYRYSAVYINSRLARNSFQKNVVLSLIVSFIFCSIWLIDTHLVTGCTMHRPDTFAPLNRIYQAEFGQGLEGISCIGQTFENTGPLHELFAYISTLTSIVFLGITWGVIMAAGIAIYHTLHASPNASRRTKMLQKELFHALVIQLIIPLVCNYIPLSAVFFTAMLELPINISFVCFAIMLDPIFEPIAIIYLIKCYRFAGLTAKRNAMYGLSWLTLLITATCVVSQPPPAPYGNQEGPADFVDADPYGDQDNDMNFLQNFAMRNMAEVRIQDAGQVPEPGMPIYAQNLLQQPEPEAPVPDDNGEWVIRDLDGVNPRPDYQQLGNEFMEDQQPAGSSHQVLPVNVPVRCRCRPEELPPVEEERDGTQSLSYTCQICGISVIFYSFGIWLWYGMSHPDDDPELISIMSASAQNRHGETADQPATWSRFRSTPTQEILNRTAVKELDEPNLRVRVEAEDGSYPLRTSWLCEMWKWALTKQKQTGREVAVPNDLPVMPPPDILYAPKGPGAKRKMKNELDLLDVLDETEFTVVRNRILLNPEGSKADKDLSEKLKAAHRKYSDVVKQARKPAAPGEETINLKLLDTALTQGPGGADARNQLGRQVLEPIYRAAAEFWLSCAGVGLFDVLQAFCKDSEEQAKYLTRLVVALTTNKDAIVVPNK